MLLTISPALVCLRQGLCMAGWHVICYVDQGGLSTHSSGIKGVCRHTQCHLLLLKNPLTSSYSSQARTFARQMLVATQHSSA